MNKRLVLWAAILNCALLFEAKTVRKTKEGLKHGRLLPLNSNPYYWASPYASKLIYQPQPMILASREAPLTENPQARYMFIRDFFQKNALKELFNKICN